MSRAVVLASLLMASACAESPDVTEDTSEVANPDLPPNGHKGGVHNQSGSFSGGSTIRYHGGPVMESAVNVYYIWYGNWSGNTATTILPAMASAIGNTPYYNINKGYYDIAGTTKHYVTGQVNFAGQANDAYSLGTSLDDAGVQTVVENAIAANNWPGGINDLYFVLTSADVAESTGFCSQYCGWHWYGTDSLTGNEIRYAFIGNPDKCPSSCEAQTTGPNGNAGADGMASIITHELEEANTDPQGNAWYDSRGYEDADKCAWTFGTTHTAQNGSKYNVTWGGKQYLVQQEWKVTGGCALQ
jgi:hypothetical protein